MKKIVILLVVLVTLPISAQQSCSPFYPSIEGQTYVVHQFNRKNKLSTITEHTITDKTAGTINLAMRLKNERGEEIISGAFKVNCEDGETKLDPEALMSPGLRDQYKSMEYTILGNGLTYPKTLNVGQTLPDGEILMKVDAGIMSMTIEITMTNRKVEREEKVITPAGTFDCYVITYTNTLKMGATQTNYTTQWIAKGVGMVKEETRKTNGKLVTKSILHEIN